MQSLKDWTMDYLKGLETGYREGEGREQTVLREQTRRVKDWVTACLKLKGGRKRTTLGVIELNSALTLPRPNCGSSRFHLDSVKVEEYEVGTR